MKKIKCKKCGHPNNSLSKNEDVLCNQCKTITGYPLYSMIEIKEVEE